MTVLGTCAHCGDVRLTMREVTVRVCLPNNEADTGYEEFQVEEIPFLDDLAVETVDTVQGNYFAIYWDGRVRHERIGEPTPRLRLTGLPEDEGQHDVELMPTCDVTVSAFE